MQTVEIDPWSVSEADLYDTIGERYRQGDDAVLATMVAVEGSAYRRPGAKMLIVPGETSLGSVTAGCLEGPVVDLASQVISEGNPRVETFDLMGDDEWGLGLGCNGIIDILLEPVDMSVVAAVDRVVDRSPVTVLTSVKSNDSSVEVGARTVLDDEGEPIETGDRDSLLSDILDSLDTPVGAAGADSATSTVTMSTERGKVTVLVDSLQPSPRLLLFGNQNDIYPVSWLGRKMGFEVIVASGRGAKRDDFPTAHETVITHPTEIPEVTDKQTYVVLMSHNFIDDRLALAALLNESEVPYVGLMGPRERFEEMREAFDEEGTTFTDAQLARVSTPVGLDIGGGEPVQIALSIVGEVVAVHNGRSGGRLKDAAGHIHDRTELSSAE